VSATTRPSVQQPLSGAFAVAPAAEALRPLPATRRLARSQVEALLTASPAFHELPVHRRRVLNRALVKIAAYLAELVRDDWCQSRRIGQTPVLRVRREVQQPPALTLSAAAEFRPAAANQIARVTQQTLNAVSFPTFVADLIQGTFNAIIRASIEQMEAFTNMLENVGKTVDQFMTDNITDNQARDWLAERYPDYLRVREGRLTVAARADEQPPPNWRTDLQMNDDVPMDEESIEELLVPAARRKLAQNRLRLLSTIVLMGINRIVVTSGKIRATMGFHIDTTDRAREERATDLDLRHSASGRFGFGPWSASAALSVAYVRSTRASSDAELNVDADLTGEVDIRFRSDFFPLQRFASEAGIDRIRANTANPAGNAPSGAALGGSGESAPVGRYTSPRSRRTARPENRLRAVGTLPPAPRAPTTPTPPQQAPPAAATPATPSRPSDRAAPPQTSSPAPASSRSTPPTRSTPPPSAWGGSEARS
jgi:hypothetical protein